MNRKKLQSLIFMALCCSMGVFAKRLISPVAHLITDSLRIPGGVGTAFSLMFLVLASVFVKRFGSAAIMGAVQSLIAVSLGQVGNMGVLAPLGYIIPGLIIDIILFGAEKLRIGRTEAMVIANSLGAASASLVANLIVFRLFGIVLCLYVCVSLCFGALFGFLGSVIAKKLEPALRKE